jgi:hypothetical protein
MNSIAPMRLRGSGETLPVLDLGGVLITDLLSSHVARKLTKDKPDRR